MKPEVDEPALSKAHSGRWHLAIVTLTTVLLLYAGFTYLLMPRLWSGYVRRHPSIDGVPNITYTSAGIPGDPLNVALIGVETQVKKAMLAAGWFPADPLTLKSCLEIADATVLRRSYRDAPVSNLYLFGRKEDLAFEQPVGSDPRRRHHVRFWRTEKLDSDGRPFWIGSATYDESVGFSHTTGQITHHIDANVDAERDHLFSDLRLAGALAEFYVEENFHRVLTGRNGGGDPWHTDGRLFVGALQSE